MCLSEITLCLNHFSILLHHCGFATLIQIASGSAAKDMEKLESLWESWWDRSQSAFGTVLKRNATQQHKAKTLSNFLSPWWFAPFSPLFGLVLPLLAWLCQSHCLFILGLVSLVWRSNPLTIWGCCCYCCCCCCRCCCCFCSCSCFRLQNPRRFSQPPLHKPPSHPYSHAFPFLAPVTLFIMARSFLVCLFLWRIAFAPFKLVRPPHLRNPYSQDFLGTHRDILAGLAPLARTPLWTPPTTWFGPDLDPKKGDFRSKSGLNQVRGDAL